MITTELIRIVLDSQSCMNEVMYLIWQVFNHDNDLSPNPLAMHDVQYDCDREDQRKIQLREVFFICCQHNSLN